MSVLFDVVINDNVLESIWEVRLGQPDTSSGSCFWDGSIASINWLGALCWRLKISRWTTVNSLTYFSLIKVNLELALTLSSSLWRWRSIWHLNWLRWISSPSIDLMLLSFHDLIIGECRQVVDDWMFSNGSLNFDKSVLSWCLLFSLIKVFLVLFLFFLSHSLVFIFAHASISLLFMRRCKWA